MSNESSPVGNVTTYTYLDNQDNAHEVVLLPLDRSLIGIENSYPPPNIEDNNLSIWLRKGYFFLGDNVLVEIPRNASELPLEQEADQITDIIYSDKTIAAYYPVSPSKAVCLKWEYTLDNWSAEYTDCEISNGAIDPESLATSGTIVWSINPER